MCLCFIPPRFGEVDLALEIEFDHNVSVVADERPPPAFDPLSEVIPFRHGPNLLEARYLVKKIPAGLYNCMIVRSEFKRFVGLDEGFLDVGRAFGKGIARGLGAVNRAIDSIPPKEVIFNYPLLMRHLTTPEGRQAFMQKWAEAAEQGRQAVLQELERRNLGFVTKLGRFVKWVADFFHLPALLKMIPGTTWDVTKAPFGAAAEPSMATFGRLVRELYNVAKIPVAVAMTGLTAVTAYQQSQLTGIPTEALMIANKVMAWVLWLGFMGLSLAGKKSILARVIMALIFPDRLAKGEGDDNRTLPQTLPSDGEGDPLSAGGRSHGVE